MYTHFTFTLLAHCTSGAIRGSVSCSRTLRQGIELANCWLLNYFSTPIPLSPRGVRCVLHCCSSLRWGYVFNHSDTRNTALALSFTRKTKNTPATDTLRYDGSFLWLALAVALQCKIACFTTMCTLQVLFLLPVKSTTNQCSKPRKLCWMHN